MTPQTRRADDELNRLANRSRETSQAAQLNRRPKLAEEARRIRVQLLAARVSLGIVPFGYLPTAEALIVSASAQLNRIDELIARAARVSS